MNGTETNDEGHKPSLITDVRVKPTTATDNKFVQDAVGTSAEVTGNLAKHINADGAYQSEDNREFAQDNLIVFVTSGLQGKPSRYDLALNSDKLTVVDKATDEIIPTTK